MRLQATLALLCLLLAPASNGAEAPAGKPAAKGPEENKAETKFKDSLIPGYDDSFIVDGKWAEGLKYYRAELIAMLAAEKPDLLAGQRLLYAHDVCRLFPAIKAGVPSPDDHLFTQWLLQHPGLVRMLGAAVRPEDDAAGVFRVLYLLKKKGPLRKPAFENLMVALAIVYDKEVKEADLEGDGGKVMELFRYYVKNAAKFRDNPKSVPYFMLKYVVDGKVPTEERDWALKRHGGSATVWQLYGNVPYDHELFKEGESKKRDRLNEEGYTLENIKKYGGLCGDQAYFATQVCKSIGMPAAAFSARGTKTGRGHAWASAARKTGDGWNWLDAGRFGRPGQFTFMPGKTTDPQTGKPITDRDCWLETQLSRVNATRRFRSRFCLTAAMLLDETGDPKRAAAFLKLAVQLNPYSAEAWLAVARFCSERKLKTDAVWGFYEAMVEKFKDYPEFTKSILEQLRELIPENDIKRRTKLFDMTWEVYQRRYPDVGAKTLAEKGDYLMSRGQPKAAFNVYTDAVMRYRHQGPLLEMLLEKIEEVYRSRDAVKGYIKLVERVMSTYRKQRAAAMRGVGYRNTTFYKLASELHGLYLEIGDKRNARAYEKLMQQSKIQPRHGGAPGRLPPERPKQR